GRAYETSRKYAGHDETGRADAEEDAGRDRADTRGRIGRRRHGDRAHGRQEERDRGEDRSRGGGRRRDASGHGDGGVQRSREKSGRSHAREDGRASWWPRPAAGNVLAAGFLKTRPDARLRRTARAFDSGVQATARHRAKVGAAAGF